jgi:AcrR family transcriptional regulator
VQDGSATRERILEEARDLFVAGGMNGFSMRKVAERVGVSATAIYRHFEGKETLLLAVVEAGFELFTSYLLRARSGATAAERLERSGEAYLRFALDHPGYYRVMFMSSREDFGFERLPAQSVARQTGAFGQVVARVGECQDAGLLRPGDPGELAVLLWSFSHGLASLYLGGHLRQRYPDPEAFVRFFLQARRQLLAGLAPDPARDNQPERSPT